VRRTLTWLVTLPFAGASVLIGHTIAYRAVGAGADDLHGYLDHAPQILLVLATLAVFGLAADSRARRRSPMPLASLAVVAFVAQEHLERLIHTGHVPFLLASPALWLGIALQLPLAIAVWFGARTVAGHIRIPGPPHRAPRIASLPILLVAGIQQPIAVVGGFAHPGRGPPERN
jgi:hypothetical protein